MVLRWVIRSLFLLALAFCVSAWISSYFTRLALYYAGPTPGSWCGWCETHIGGFDFGSTYADWSPSGWRFSKSSVVPGPGVQIGPWPKERFAGFYYRWATAATTAGFGGRHFALGIPFYCPTLLAALALLLVWRKTRPGPSVASAFPVEMNASNGPA